MDMKNIAEKAAELDQDIEKVKLDIKRVQSIKCRLLRQKARKDYASLMSNVLNEEQLLKEVRNYLEPKKATVTTISQEQVDMLTYDDTIKAIKSIQSKKTNTKYLTEDINTNVEHQEALRIEKMLKAHRELVRPIEETVVKKTDIMDLINDLENLNKLDKEYVIDRLQNLLG